MDDLFTTREFLTIFFIGFLPGVGLAAYVVGGDKIEKFIPLLAVSMGLLIGCFGLAINLETKFLAYVFGYVSVFGCGFFLPVVSAILIIAGVQMNVETEQVKQAEQPINLTTIDKPKSKELEVLSKLSTDEKLSKIIEHNKRK